MALKIEKKVKLLLRKGKKVFNIFSSFYTFVAFVGAVGLLPFALVLYLGKFNRVRFLVIVEAAQRHSIFTIYDVWSL